jgi:alkanesulfonate monooxygenase SsuD/methylene tetrahydromethanopterin reductase-like flavin-dependent oxidoreductase (luciferase family)
MRFGLTILPELPWAELRPRWEAAEAMGFDHAWTYDHLVWGGLPDSPWYGTMPTLTAAALVTERIGLGTFVSSPNFRHPYLLHRDAPLSTRQRVDRFQEFVELLVQLRTADHVDADGQWGTPEDPGVEIAAGTDAEDEASPGDVVERLVLRA